MYIVHCSVQQYPHLLSSKIRSISAWTSDKSLARELLAFSKIFLFRGNALVS